MSKLVASKPYRREAVSQSMKNIGILAGLFLSLRDKVLLMALETWLQLHLLKRILRGGIDSASTVA